MCSAKAPLSVVVLAKNEEQNIQRCIQSLHWAAEVVVVDDNSTDETASIALNNGARVLQHPFESFAEQRNWALAYGELCFEWVLMLDADEVSTQEFAAQVSNKIETASRQIVAFKTCRKTMFGGTWLRRSDSFPVWIMRIVRRGQAWFEDSGHGEVPVPTVDGSIGAITEPFVHYPFSRGLIDWWQRHARYAEREAIRELEFTQDTGAAGLLSFDPSKRRRALRGIARKLPARGTLRFLYQYILKRGFMDGIAGLQFCRMMASYERMIVIKKWEIEKGDKEEADF